MKNELRSSLECSICDCDLSVYTPATEKKATVDLVVGDEGCYVTYCVCVRLDCEKKLWKINRFVNNRPVKILTSLSDKISLTLGIETTANTKPIS